MASGTRRAAQRQDAVDAARLALAHLASRYNPRGESAKVLACALQDQCLGRVCVKGLDKTAQFIRKSLYETLQVLLAQACCRASDVAMWWAWSLASSHHLTPFSGNSNRACQWLLNTFEAAPDTAYIPCPPALPLDEATRGWQWLLLSNDKAAIVFQAAEEDVDVDILKDDDEEDEGREVLI